METGKEKPPPSSPALPPDLLLEVLARCDYETIVRSAASSKILCRCMQDDPTFLGRCTSGFAPSLLLGVLSIPSGAKALFVEAPTSTIIPRDPIHSFLSSNADFLESFDELLACGSGHFVLRRGRRFRAIELCVCNPMTGGHYFLPPPIIDDKNITILTGDAAAGCSSPFQLLAVGLDWDYWRGDRRLHIKSQLFATQKPSPAGKPISVWSPIRTVVTRKGYNCVLKNPPVVIINRVAHWLCTFYLTSSKRDVIALHIDDGHVDLISGPGKLPNSGTALLASTGDRRLSLVVTDDFSVSVFVQSNYSEDWELRASVIVAGSLTRDHWMVLECFSQRSGIVVIGMKGVAGHLLLNLETKEVTHMPADRELYWPGHLFEMDLPSLIAFMLKSSPS